MKTTCKVWPAVVSKDKWVTQSYVRERHCLFGSASLPPNSAFDLESASSPASCSVASCDCWENVFSIVLFLCSIFALRVFDRLFSFFWAALMTGMSDISCDSLHGEKNEGNIYSLLFFVGFSFLFGARGAYSSGWEPNFNARFFLKDKQLEQVMPLLSMTARAFAVKH